MNNEIEKNLKEGKITYLAAATATTLLRKQLRVSLPPNPPPDLSEQKKIKSYSTTSSPSFSAKSVARVKKIGSISVSRQLPHLSHPLTQQLG